MSTCTLGAVFFIYFLYFFTVFQLLGFKMYTNRPSEVRIFWLGMENYRKKIQNIMLTITKESEYYADSNNVNLP